MKPVWIAGALFAILLIFGIVISLPTFKKKGCSLEVRIVFGYKDARPARFVADRYEKMLFLEKILGPCSAGRMDCEFVAQTSPNPDSDEFYLKEIKGPEGELKHIGLKVIHSSVSPDDDSNRSDPFQKWQSEYAYKQFADGIQNADIVFYNGHSRLGGGPDFSPPKLSPDNHVDYDWYQKNQTAFSSLLTSLSSSKHLQALGVFSCSSTQHFSKKIEKTKKGLRLYSSNKPIYFSDALRSSLDALSNLLKLQQCQKLN